MVHLRDAIAGLADRVCPTRVGECVRPAVGHRSFFARLVGTGSGGSYRLVSQGATALVRCGACPLTCLVCTH